METIKGQSSAKKAPRLVQLSRDGNRLNVWIRSDVPENEGYDATVSIAELLAALGLEVDPEKSN